VCEVRPFVLRQVDLHPFIDADQSLNEYESADWVRRKLVT
jgi:hypothetical protein